jgi:hypothetical protein
VHVKGELDDAIGKDIIKAVDDNINVDMNNKTEDVEKAVESDNVKETLEDVVL